MKLILLAENENLYSSKRLMDEARILGLEAEHINPYQVSFELTPHSTHDCQNTFVLHRSTGIRFDDFDLCLSEHLESHGATIINSLKTIRTLRDKLSQHLFFEKAGLPAMPTFAMRGKLDLEKLEDVCTRFSALSKESKFIVKTERGNKGIGVNLLESKQSLFGLLETFWGMQDQRFILQPYLPGDEFRVLIIGGVITGVIHKQASQSDYRKNANRSIGVYKTIDQVPAMIIDTAKKCYNQAEALVAGIDLIYHNSQVYILECNLVPGFEAMEALSGKNHAREIITAALNEREKNEITK